MFGSRWWIAMALSFGCAARTGGTDRTKQEVHRAPPAQTQTPSEPAHPIEAPGGADTSKVAAGGSRSDVSSPTAEDARELCRIRARHHDGEGTTCACDDVTQKRGAAEGWSGVALLRIRCAYDETGESFVPLELAVHDANGWRCFARLPTAHNANDSTSVDVDFETAELDPSPGLELQARVDIRDFDGGIDVSVRRREYTVICGAADAGWCTSLPTLAQEGRLVSGKTRMLEPRLRTRLTFDGAGSVTISGAGASTDVLRLREIELPSGTGEAIVIGCVDGAARSIGGGPGSGTSP